MIDIFFRYSLALSPERTRKNRGRHGEMGVRWGHTCDQCDSLSHWRPKPRGDLLGFAGAPAGCAHLARPNALAAGSSTYQQHPSRSLLNGHLFLAELDQVQGWRHMTMPSTCDFPHFVLALEHCVRTWGRRSTFHCRFLILCLSTVDLSFVWRQLPDFSDFIHSILPSTVLKGEDEVNLMSKCFVRMGVHQLPSREK